MRWLHISDIHFNIKGYDAKSIREKLIVKLKELDLQMDFILITGDSLFKFGKDAWNHKLVIRYIKELANACKCSCKRVYICPGNHDVNREDNARNKLINDIRNGKKDFSDNFSVLCGSGHDRFQIIHKGVTSYDYEAYKVFEPRKNIYRIISIDSCLISKDNEDNQKLQIFNEKIFAIGKKVKCDKKVNILIMHHGIECLELSEARKFQHWVEENNIDIVCCGHTHRAAVNSYDDIRRDIKQFTAGAIVVDDNAIPSFYVCEYTNVKFQIEMSLYTFALKTEEWALDNQLLRKFNNGKYIYELSRHKKMIIENEEQNALSFQYQKSYEDISQDNSLISDEDDNKTSLLPATINNLQRPEAESTQVFEVELITRYLNKYGSDRIYSNRHSGYERFDSWKIVDSLVEVGINYTKALKITYAVVREITSNKFQSKDNILSCEELRDAVYNSIINYQISEGESEYEVSCWASRYARKYSRKKEIIVITIHNEQSKLNYDYVKNTLLKYIVDDVTNNQAFYEKIFRNELNRMADDVLSFLKKMEIFEIREDALIEIVSEYITQKPHPWLVNGNRNELIKYHKEQGVNHINDLKFGKNRSLITQMEAAYHTCAAFLVQYDDFIGCTETSPITILAKTVNNMSNKNQSISLVLPMLKYQIIQLKKDLENHNIKFSDFSKNINILYKNIVNAQKISLDETKNALIELWNMLIQLEKPLQKREPKTSLERVRYIFTNARGFIVKNNLRELKNCFWVEPNWEEYEICQQRLGKQILVCVLQNVSDVEEIYSYLYLQNGRGTITEIVFVLSDYSVFSSVQRKDIRSVFKGKYLRCIFIQEENFKHISETQDWRTLFYRVLQNSKIG